MTERRRPYPVTHEGETLFLADWSERLKISYHTLYGRLIRGYTDSEIILGKHNEADPLIILGAWKRPMSWWSRVFRVKPTLMRERLKRGLQHEFVVFGKPRSKPVKPVYLRVGDVAKTCGWWSLRTSQRATTIERRIKDGLCPVDAIFAVDPE
ncbi:hypothetical protein [Planctomycetes bacterium K23_9]|uniref:Uncharacterized protein n=1 Tax=Stieleria marina TaxID=1930275 RepID=A0A517NW25_9BACT|nr:hypothetical protein K239x_32930 [Planctomycetes bacterium K23_9]